MNNKEYTRKLTDPRWQKKRFEILHRDNFTCLNCGDDKSELHVHHINYINNPWDANSEMLITLCHNCHELIHKTGYKIIIEENGFLSVYDFIKIKPVLIIMLTSAIENYKGVWRLKLRNVFNINPVYYFELYQLILGYTKNLDNQFIFEFDGVEVEFFR